MSRHTRWAKILAVREGVDIYQGSGISTQSTIKDSKFMPAPGSMDSLKEALAASVESKIMGKPLSSLNRIDSKLKDPNNTPAAATSLRKYFDMLDKPNDEAQKKVVKKKTNREVAAKPAADVKVDGWKTMEAPVVNSNFVEKWVISGNLKTNEPSITIQESVEFTKKSPNNSRVIRGRGLIGSPRGLSTETIALSRQMISVVQRKLQEESAEIKEESFEQINVYNSLKQKNPFTLTSSEMHNKMYNSKLYEEESAQEVPKSKKLLTYLQSQNLKVKVNHEVISDEELEENPPPGPKSPKTVLQAAEQAKPKQTFPSKETIKHTKSDKKSSVRRRRKAKSKNTSDESSSIEVPGGYPPITAKEAWRPSKSKKKLNTKGKKPTKIESSLEEIEVLNPEVMALWAPRSSELKPQTERLIRVTPSTTSKEDVNIIDVDYSSN